MKLHIEPDHFIYKLIQKDLLGRSDNLSRTRNKKRQIRKIRSSCLTESRENSCLRVETRVPPPRF